MTDHEATVVDPSAAPGPPVQTTADAPWDPLLGNVDGGGPPPYRGGRTAYRPRARPATNEEK